MIDIHCHLLPGIDDGAADIAQSLALARHAVSDGMTHLVCTPHIHPGVYDNDICSISRAFALFSEALEINNIPLQINWAAEVRLCPEVMGLLDAGRLPLFRGAGGKQTVLLEFPHSHVPPGSEQLLKWLIANGVQVLIAHPERNKTLMRHVDRVTAFVEMGCLLQVTSGSLSGRFGPPARQAAEQMLLRGQVGVLASDAHNLRARPPELSDGLAVAAALIGLARANELVLDRPKQLVCEMFGNE